MKNKTEHALGIHHTALAEAKGPRETLLAASRLLYEQGFDPVLLGADAPKLEHEARCSESCEPCGAVWFGSKAGELLQIELRTEGIYTRARRYDSGVRAILHLHDAEALGGACHVLVGTDAGFLHILEPGHDLVPEQSRRIHVETWWRDGGQPIGPATSIERAGTERYTIGVTAIADIGASEGAARLLVATRSGALFLIRASQTGMEIERLKDKDNKDPDVSGWIQWIVRQPEDGDTHVTAISRGGELLRVSTAEPVRLEEPVALALLPTVASPWQQGILLGTTEGLVHWQRGRRPLTISLPLTRTAVLCLDRPRNKTRRESRRFIVMGLDNGRLRIVHEEVLRDLVERHTALPGGRSRATDLGSAVLALEVLPSNAPDLERCLLVAALRDHTIRIFHIDCREHLVAAAAAKFDEAARAGTVDPLRAWDALLDAAASPDERDAMTYLLLDVVYGRLHADPAVSAAGLHERLIRAANGASVPVLRRISRGIGEFTGKDADALLAISIALLRAMPRDDTKAWSQFVGDHLKALHQAARRIDVPEDRARLIAWTRFVRKYVMMGRTFAEKPTSLRRLIAANTRTRKFLDGLVYLAQLYQHRHDFAWTAAIDGEVHSIHVASRVIVAAARDGQLWFFDHEGRQLGKEGGGEGGRMLAAAVVRDDASRVLLAVSRSNRTTGIDDLSMLTLDLDKKPGSVQVISQAVDTSRLSAGVAVHSLCALPHSGDTVLAGLNKSELLFGILRRLRDRWQIEAVPAAAQNGGCGAADLPQPSEGPAMLAPGEVPSRAIAAALIDAKRPEDDDTWIVIVGSEDGTVRIVRFEMLRWRDHPSVLGTHQLPHAVRAVAIDPIVNGAGIEEGGLACYAGTSNGELFAGDVTPKCDVRPVWRETYDRSVLAIQPWSTPLYEKARVLAAVTERGRLCLYDTRLWRSEDKPVLSEMNNYAFRGSRLDRISLPAPLTAFTLIDGTRDFVAAGPGGRIQKGALVYTRDSVDRTKDDTLEDGLPRCLWDRLEALGRKLEYGALFFPHLEEIERRAREREICELVDLDSGALRRYLLRVRLTGSERWGTDPEKIKLRAHEYLGRLRPAVREGRELIKIVLKSLAREVLDAPLDALLDQIRARRSAEALCDAVEPQHDAAVAAVTVLLDQITGAVRLPASHAGRLRIIAFKELFRIHTLRHAAVERGRNTPVRDALTHALRVCLRDDDPLVRIEALRAGGLMLRNATVLSDILRREEPSLAGELLRHLFPRGVEDLLWAIDLVAETLKHHPHFSWKSLHSVAWSYVSPLTPILRLFPESTLVLCNRLTRAGVGIGTLEVLAQRLGTRATHRAALLINKLYVLPGEATTRAVFVTDYKKPALEDWFARMLPDFRLDTTGEPIPEVKIARRLIAVFDWLARFWEWDDPDKLRKLPSPPAVDWSLTESAARGRTPGPIGAAERLCEDLHGLAKRIAASDRSAEHEVKEERRRLSGDHHGRLPDRVRRIAVHALDHWLSKIAEPLPGEGNEINGYQLLRWLGEGGYAKAHLANGPQGRVAVKVFRLRDDPNQEYRTRFLKGAQMNRDLLNGCEEIARVLEIIDTKGSYPLYVVEYCNRGNLLTYLQSEDASKPDPARPFRCAISVADQIGAALRYAHARTIVHGDVHARNILVHEDRDHEIHFKLADFDLAYATGERNITEGLYQSLTRGSIDGLGPAYRLDALGLARVLCQVLVGLSIGAGDVKEALSRLRQIDCGGDGKVQRLVDALRGLLGDPEVPPVVNAKDFLNEIDYASQEKRCHLVTVLIKHGVSRDALLVGVPVPIVARLRNYGRPDEQLLSDLTNLYDLEADGERMIQIVFQNAQSLIPEPDRSLFDWPPPRRGARRRDS